jgi:hypothetical protein
MTDQERQMEAHWPFMDDTNFRDVLGNIMPWYTWNALQWIKANIPKGVRVLEFGGGHSTLWWRKRADVFTIEFDPKACEILKISPMSPLKYFNTVHPDGEKNIYDVVIVDSEAELSRQDYVIRAFDLSKKYVIIDNYQQPEICMYPQETIDYLMANSKEHHIFNQPSHRDGTWQTAIFIK